MLGAFEVFQHVCAEIFQRRLRGRILAYQIGGDARQQHLATMAERQEARDAVEGRPEVVTVAFVGGSGVDRHPNAQAVHRREVGCTERALRIERGGALLIPASRRLRRTHRRRF